MFDYATGVVEMAHMVISRGVVKYSSCIGINNGVWIVQVRCVSQDSL